MWICHLYICPPYICQPYLCQKCICMYVTHIYVLPIFVPISMSGTSLQYVLPIYVSPNYVFPINVLIYVSPIYVLPIFVPLYISGPSLSSLSMSAISISFLSLSLYLCQPNLVNIDAMLSNIGWRKRNGRYPSMIDQSCTYVARYRQWCYFAPLYVTLALSCPSFLIGLTCTDKWLNSRKRFCPAKLDQFS